MVGGAMNAMKVSEAGGNAGDFNHAVVWIDHHVARIMHFDRERWTLVTVHPRDAHSHLHHKANAIDSGHLPEDQHYLHDVVKAIGNVEFILITGPANEKLELYKHIERHDAAMRSRIAAVQPLDHPSDGELLSHALAYFHAEGRMRAQL
jgi:hypothetical protein